jgi:hypothetical protein
MNKLSPQQLAHIHSHILKMSSATACTIGEVADMENDMISDFAGLVNKLDKIQKRCESIRQRSNQEYQEEYFKAMDKAK